jgi:hypothetical protein
MIARDKRTIIDLGGVGVGVRGKPSCAWFILTLRFASFILARICLRNAQMRHFKKAVSDSSGQLQQHHGNRFRAINVPSGMSRRTSAINASTARCSAKPRHSRSFRPNAACP